MGEVLSQDEIDKLLRAMTAGDLEVGEMQRKSHKKTRRRSKIMTLNVLQNFQKST